MKTIVVVLLLIVCIVLADHYDLLNPDPRYPEPVNRLIHKMLGTDDKTRPANQTLTDSDPATIQSKTLYQWKDDRGQWVISDHPPKDRVYKTITLSNDADMGQSGEATAGASDQTPSGTALSGGENPEQALLQRSRCEYFLEQIAAYKKKSAFGGTSQQLDQRQRQITWYQRQYLKSGCAEISVR